VFTFYSAPTYTGIAPANAANNVPAAVTITGTNYYGTPIVKLKKAGEADIPATGVTLTGSTGISCTFNLTGAPLGTWYVEITNPDAQSVTSAGVFTVTLPTPTYTNIPSGSDSSASPDSIIVITGPMNVGTGTMVAIVSPSGTSLPGPVQVTGLTITPNVDIGGSLITVKPADLGDQTLLPGNPPAAYFEIVMLWVRSDAVREAEIRFTVPESWLAEHHIAPEEVAMMRYHDGVWAVLPTRFESRNGGTCSFIATTPGFSYFAVTRTTMAAAAETIAVQTAVPLATLADTVISVPSTPVSTQPATQNEKTTPPVIMATTTVPAPPSSSSPVLPTAVIVAGLIGILIGGFLVRRWWIRRQNPALFRDFD
jgi:PGF-pre-PGF domain-containing protein